jgi:hypothetical protein
MATQQRTFWQHMVELALERKLACDTYFRETCSLHRGNLNPELLSHCSDPLPIGAISPPFLLLYGGGAGASLCMSTLGDSRSGAGYRGGIL